MNADDFPLPEPTPLQDLSHVSWDEVQEWCRQNMRATLRSWLEQGGAAPAERAPYITDDQVIEWAEGFIQQKAFNRPIALQIAVRSAQWVRDQYEPPTPQKEQP